MKKISLFTIAILIVFCLLSCDQQQEHEHVWGDEVITRAATCLEDGEAVLRCSCGKTKTVVIEKLGHDIEEVVTEPTCLRKGRIDYNCSRCDATELRESIVLESLGLEGYGFSQYYYYTYSSTGHTWIMFEDYTFLADNEMESISNSMNLYYWEVGRPYELTKYTTDYVIREKEDSEGNIVSYITFFGILEVPISEEDGRLFITWPWTDEGEKIIELTKEHHIHSGEEVYTLVSPTDIINEVPQNAYDDCQMFTCDECVIDGRNVVVYTEHKKGIDGKCVYCGATIY